jgi:hypothetical protein
MGHLLTLSAPDGTHAVQLHQDFQDWTLAPGATAVPDEVRDKGRAFMASPGEPRKTVPRDVLWLWVRALRAAWRRAPKTYLQIWLKGPNGQEQSTPAYLTDGKASWMVAAERGKLVVSRLTPAQAERQKKQKALWLRVEPADAAAWAKAGAIPPEEFARLTGDGSPLRLEHATPGQHFAKELAALEALVLHLEATGLPNATCTAT